MAIISKTYRNAAEHPIEKEDDSMKSFLIMEFTVSSTVPNRHTKIDW